MVVHDLGGVAMRLGDGRSAGVSYWASERRRSAQIRNKYPNVRGFLTGLPHSGTARHRRVLKGSTMAGLAKSLSRGARPLIFAAALLLSAAAGAEARPLFPIEPPPAYIIDAYLDRAPKGATVVDRVQIFAAGQPKRWLLVTSYRAPGEIPLAEYLSWPLEHTYAVSGKRDDIARLLGAPAGAQIKGTFLVYTRNYPLLVIAELDQPA